MDLLHDPTLRLWLPLYEREAGDGNAFVSADAYSHQCTPGNHAAWGMRGFAFDGADDYLSAGASAVLHPTQMTISAVVRLDTYAAAGQSSIVVARTGAQDYQFFIYPDGGGTAHKLCFTPWSGGVQQDVTGTVVPLGQWLWLAVTWDTAGATLYRGITVDGTGAGSAIDAAGTVVYCGALNNTGVNGLTGVISDIMIFGRALSSLEAHALYLDARRRMPWLT